MQELRRTHRKLQHSNRVVLMHIAQMQRHSSEQQRKICKLLGIDARQIDSLLRICDRIIESNEPESIFISLSFVCPRCPKRERIQDQSESSSSQSFVDLDPAWMDQVDWSLELLRRTEEHIFLRGLTRGMADDRLFPSLDRLRKALLRQKSYLTTISPAQTKPIVTVEQGYRCTCDKQADPNAAQS